MRIIPINEVPKELHEIKLQNGKVAKIYQIILTRVKEVDPDNDVLVYKYTVPCPICDYENPAFSYDGRFFGNVQISCRHCGVFYRPVVKRN